jgi:acetylornithine deacetylase/succinyl-diaminopimelate desuccinylase-like protein
MHTAMTSTTPAPLERERRSLAERACAEIDPERLAELCLEMTAIPSPTGEELALASYLAERLRAAGLEGTVQLVDGRQANAIGRLRGSGDGPELLVYAPTDTAFGGSGDLAEDRPWLGDRPRPDFALPPRREGTKVIGLGAENPKGFAACAVAAAEALARAGAGASLRGDLVVALASGSMPIGGRPGSDRRNLGFGSGITYMLEHGVTPDFAIVLKPGYAVVHEEVGLAWFRLTVRGLVGYTGARHKGPYRNVIVDAATVVSMLEAWFAEYTKANASGQVAPQGAVNAITAGHADRGAFNPATCEISVDLRVSPRISLREVARQLSEALERARAAVPGLDVTAEMTAGLPGSHTPPQSWIVQSLIRAWEDREQREHRAPGGGSGASDGAILRGHGIPTARIGLPPPDAPSPYPGFSMGVVDSGSMRRLTEVLVRAIVDTTTRTRADVGLED